MAHMKSINNSIVVQGIITKQGRQRLASGVDSFNITKFAVADDQIDYSVINRTNVGDYPILQPVINGQLMMKSKLYTDYSVNQGNLVLSNIFIDGLSQETVNNITSKRTLNPTTIPSGAELYTIKLDLSNGNPFSSIQYKSSANDSLKGVSPTGNILTISSVYQLVLTPKTSSKINTTVNLNVAGMNTGVSTSYRLNVVSMGGSNVEPNTGGDNL